MPKATVNPAGEASNATARCGAEAAGGPCENRPEPGRTRCRLHGGAPGSGAPHGERNGRYVDGNHTKEAIAERRWVRDMLRANGMAESSRTEVAPTRRSDLADERGRVSAEVGKVEETAYHAARPPHGMSKEEWIEKLQVALGSQSRAFVGACLDRLMAATTLPGHFTPTSISLSAALALIESMEPENELQAALAVDAACLHAAATNMLSRLQSHIGDARARSHSLAAARLARAFHSALKTYHLFKNGHRQVIRIERIEIR